MKCLELREDLRNGMSIHDGLIKHGLSLETAVQMLQYRQPEEHYIENTIPPRKIRKPSRKKKVNYVKCGERYIMQRNDTFCVRRTIKGKTRMFGTYNSLEDALRMRDALELDGWHQTHVDRICKELGIVRRNGHPNCKVRYH